MNPDPLIVFSFDGLSPQALSCYGSSWNETPALAELAAKGCVWDRFVAQFDDPERVRRQWSDANASWKKAWGKLGPVELITDCHIDPDEEVCFDEVLSIPQESASLDRSAADDVTETQFGVLVAEAIQRASSGIPWSALWIHSGFLTRCWDAPRHLFGDFDEVIPSMGPAEDEEASELEPASDEESLAELDPNQPPPIFASPQPPHLTLDTTSHPDLITSWMRTYACQVRLIDLLIDVVQDSLPHVDPVIVVTGTSGYRLGQGSAIGHRIGSLRSADISLPLIVNRNGPMHIPHLNGSDQLDALLTSLCNDPDSICRPESWCEPTSEKPFVVTESDRCRFAMTNPRWFLVEDNDASEHLFLKPDDLNDFNNVARLEGEVVESMRQQKTPPA